MRRSLEHLLRDQFSRLQECLLKGFGIQNVDMLIADGYIEGIFCK